MQKTIDSVEILLKEAKHDTTKLRLYQFLAGNIPDDKIWPEYNNKLGDLLKVLSANPEYANLKQIKIAEGDFHNNKGYEMEITGLPDKAMFHYLFALQVYQKINFAPGIGSIYNNLGNLNYDLGNLTEAGKFFRLGLEYRLKGTDTAEIANSYNNLGGLYNHTGNLKVAMAYYLQAYKLQKKTGNTTGLLVTLNNLGNAWRKSGKITLAEKSFMLGLTLARKIGDKFNEPVLLENLGNIATSRGDMIKAQEYFFQSFAICKERKNPNTIGNTATNLSNIYLNMDEPEQAKKVMFDALTFAKSAKNAHSQFTIYNQLFKIYIAENKVDTAEIYMKLGEKICRTVGDTDGLASALHGLGVLERKKGDYLKAISLFDESIKIKHLVNSKTGIGGTYENKAWCYYELGKMREAKENAETAMDYIRPIGFPTLIRPTAELLYKIYKETGDFKKALEMHELFKKMDDSLNNINKSKTIYKNQIKFEYEEKEKLSKVEREKFELKVEEEKKRQRIILYSVIGGLIIVVFFSFILFNRIKIISRQKDIIQEQKSIVEQKQKEILDSIYYARRIQNTLLPNEKRIDSIINKQKQQAKP